MIEVYYGTEFIILLLLLAVWGITSITVNNVKYSIFRNAHEKWRRFTLIGVCAGLVLFLLWLADMMMIFTFLGWLFVIDRVLVILPLMAIPALFVIMVSVPKLKKTHFLFADSLPALLLPIQAMFIGTILAFYLATMNVPAIPDGKESTLYLGIEAVCTGLLCLYQKSRIRKIQLRPPGWGSRLARGTGITAFVLVVSLMAYTWSLQNSK